MKRDPLFRLKRIRKKFLNRTIKCVIICSITSFVVALLLDNFQCINVFSKNILKSIVGETVYGMFRVQKELCMNNLKGCREILTTFETIFAAVVVFYYGLQESKREGIPHRTILAYTYGSWSIPVLFMMTLFTVFMSYVFNAVELYWTTFIMLVLSAVLQIIAITCILLSTSHQFSLHAITNAEVDQFKLLTQLEKEKRNKKGQRRALQYVPLRTLHHLEQVATSGELLADKIEIMRRIVRVPFYNRRVFPKKSFLSYFKHLAFGKKKSETMVDAHLLASNSLKRIYEFYYENILATIERLHKENDTETINSVLLILYEFIDELKENYMGEIFQNPSPDDYRKGYLMTVSAIINAILMSNIEQSEMFCHYIFNSIMMSEHHQQEGNLESVQEKFMKSEDLWKHVYRDDFPELYGQYQANEKLLWELNTESNDWNTLLSLYFLFQECLYRIKQEAVKIDCLKDISCINNWKNCTKIEEKLYLQFWEIWVEATSLNKDTSRLCLVKAFRTLRSDEKAGDSSDAVVVHESMILSYILQVIKRKEEVLI